MPGNVQRSESNNNAEEQAKKLVLCQFLDDNTRERGVVIKKIRKTHACEFLERRP